MAVTSTRHSSPAMHEQPPLPADRFGNATEFSWRRKLAFSGVALALFMVLLVAVLAAAELLMRSLAPQSDAARLGVRLEHSERLFGLRPNARSLQTGVMVETNSLGFRERDYPLARAPGTGRTVVLGDSYTFGVGVEFADIFSKRLEAQLNGSGSRHEVINFGVPAYNTVTELATFREVAARFRPDLVIVAYVLNDTERLGRPGETPADSQPRTALTAAHLGLKDRSMLYRYLAPKAGAVLGIFNARYAIGMTHRIIGSYADDSPGWIESRQALLDIAAEARAIGAATLVVVFPMMVDFATYPLEPAHQRITRFCREHGIEVLDLLPRFRGENAAELAVFLDGHPNARAHALFADEILRHLSDRSPGSGA
jgi:lysophospholipase L1-like esterase